MIDWIRTVSVSGVREDDDRRAARFGFTAALISSMCLTVSSVIGVALAVGRGESPRSVALAGWVLVISLPYAAFSAVKLRRLRAEPEADPAPPAA